MGPGHKGGYPGPRDRSRRYSNGIHWNQGADRIRRDIR
jgi:hypothetical protein